MLVQFVLLVLVAMLGAVIGSSRLRLGTGHIVQFVRAVLSFVFGERESSSRSKE